MYLSLLTSGNIISFMFTVLISSKSISCCIVVNQIRILLICNFHGIHVYMVWLLFYTDILSLDI